MLTVVKPIYLRGTVNRVPHYARLSGESCRLRQNPAQVKYAVLYEQGPTSYGASVPDLPGGYAVGETLEDARALVAEAIAAHVRLLREDGEAVPGPSVLELVEVPLEPAV